MNYPTDHDGTPVWKGTLLATPDGPRIVSRLHFDGAWTTFASPLNDDRIDFSVDLTKCRAIRTQDAIDLLPPMDKKIAMGQKTVLRLFDMPTERVTPGALVYTTGGNVLLIISVDPSTWHVDSPEEARRMGFRWLLDYNEWMDEHHPLAEYQQCWRVEFKLLQPMPGVTANV